MARRKQSPLDDLIEVTALVPWWVGVALAGISYLILHSIASTPNPVPTDTKALGQFAATNFGIALASIFQWVLPVVFLLGAALSGFKRAKRERLHAEVAGAPSRGALESMSWREFEMLVEEMFRRKGFTVIERGGKGPDGGVDLELRLGKDKYFVQCKQWKSQKVGVAVVRELYGVMAAEGAVGGFVVASGNFTEDARSFAEGRAIELVATADLLRLIAATPSGDTPPSAMAGSAAPVCPACSATMVERVAKNGASAGERFWGCSRYPACRGTRPL